MDVKERFLRYVTFHTTSDEESGTVPSTPRQRVLGQALAEELADPLHSVDRKFLFSFWRECFQNRQQLFLVFLRAEPLTVGGSTGDALANSQLGARGVALVWRDPAPPTVTGGKKATRNSRMSLTSPAAWRTQNENTGPHRTRVLFYHQFD